MRQQEVYFKEVHGDIVPGGIYAGEDCIASIWHGGKYVRCELWAISPLGCEITFDDPRLDAGNIMKIQIQTGDQKMQFDDSLVVVATEKGNRRRYGVRWTIPSENRTEQERTSRRWLCGLEFAPTISCPNPLKYNDLMLMKVLDVSKNGLRLVTSLRNRFLFPKLKLQATVNFPMTGIALISMEIIWTSPIEIDGKTNLSLGVKITDPNPRLLSLIGEYISQFGPETDAVPKTIREAGLIVPSVTKGIEFRYVRSNDEFQQVLRLRYECYHKKEPTNPEQAREMGDALDTRSRILIGVKGNRIVASARVTFHQSDDALEQAEKVDLPEDFPRNDELVEMTRVCIHPDHRAADLLLSLVSQAFIVAVQSGKKWLVGSSPENLVAVYKRFGAIVREDLTYEHELIPGTKAYVIMYELDKLLLGIGISPFYWNILSDGGKLVSFLKESGNINISPTGRLMVKLYSAFYPIAKKQFRKKMMTTEHKAK